MNTMTNPSEDTVEILIAEDSPTQAEELRFVLEKKGYRVTLARDGKQALACLNGYRPALIISDILMPEMNGYELCQHIKADENTRDIPVILLTVLSDKVDVVESLACGADSFITKPCSGEYLLKHVDQTLTNRARVSSKHAGIQVEIPWMGTNRVISTDPQQMLSLLLSTYEAAVHRNTELIQTQAELKSLNQHLENLVEQRTAALSAEIAVRQRLQEELQALSLQDELTGLYNRRGFMVMAEQLWQLAKRNHLDLALVYMDFDGLKHINDTFGHAQGDQALRDVTRLLEQVFRESDILARVGGDEFTILITGCNLADAGVVISRLNEKLNHSNATASRVYTLSLSIGLVIFDPGNPTSIEDMMEQADADMYLKKQQKKKAL